MTTYKTRLPFADFVETAAKYCGTRPEAITGYSRTPNTVRARWLVIWNARLSGYTLTEIGGALNRHHTSILHACQEMGVEPR